MDTKNELNTNGLMTWLKRSWLFVLVWFFLFYRFICNILLVCFDNDIYHMLAAGKAIAEQGIIRKDIFFIDSGHDIVIQQWLHDLIVYKVYDNFGKLGIILMTLVISALFIFFSVRLMRYYKADVRLSLTAVILICLNAGWVFTIRPAIYTMVLLLIQLCICERFRKTNKIYSLFVLPILTLIEINIHATFWPIHFIFLLPYLVPIPSFARKYIKLEDSHISIKKMVLPMLIMVASLFVNPYGLDGITILLKQKEVFQMGIQDMSAPELSSRFSIVLIVSLLVFALLYRKIRIHSGNAFLFLGTALMMITSLRNIQMYSIGLCAVLSDLVHIIPMDKIDSIFAKTKKLIIVLCALLEIVLIGICTIKTPITYAFVDEPYDSIATPVQAVEYLNANASKDSRIYTDFNAGGYVSWNGYKIYFCSRTEGYCQQVNGGYDLIGEYLAIFKNNETDCNKTFDEFLGRYDFDYLIVESRNKMYPYITSNEDYEVVLNGNGYAVVKPIG